MVEEERIPVVYLKQEHHFHSASHTALAPHPYGMRLCFQYGEAHNVPRSVYELFAKLGIATLDRPPGLKVWDLKEKPTIPLSPYSYKG